MACFLPLDPKKTFSVSSRRRAMAAWLGVLLASLLSNHRRDGHSPDQSKSAGNSPDSSRIHLGNSTRNYPARCPPVG